MASLKTLYRTLVMIATAIIVFKGWQLYGPSTEQMKSGAARALEIAQDALSRAQQPKAALVTANDPRLASPTFAATAGGAPPVAPPLDSISPPPLGPAANSAGPDAAPPSFGTLLPNTPQNENVAPLPAAKAEKLPALMSRLEALGVAEPKLASWGSTGTLYRFCCRAKLGDTTAYAQHFESVADEPAAAVEQVVAKVEAWRLAQQRQAALE